MPNSLFEETATETADLLNSLDVLTKNIASLALEITHDPLFSTSLQEERAKRREEILRHHPDGNPWPPCMECPACTKIFEKVENEAKRTCGWQHQFGDVVLFRRANEILTETYGIELIH